MADSARTLLARRFRNQTLTHSQLRTPAEVVRWLGAMQAQDYAGAKWAVGLRARALTDAAIEKAYNDGAILRTHVLRPTWHFVTPGDIRWMLALTGPRVSARMAPYNRQLELTARMFARSHAAIARALAGGKSLIRSEIAEALSRIRIQAHGQRLAHLVMQAELDQVICSGPMRGKKFTYALLEERVPRAKTLTRDEALAELVRRYFSSHGPATLRDFAWWSGLTVADAKRGTELIRGDLVTEVVDGRNYWSSARSSPGRDPRPPRTNHIRSVFLLPTYDEYLIAYKDRDLIAVPAAERTDASPFDLFANFLFVDGRLAGTWRRTVSKGSIVVSVTPHIRLSPADTRLLNAEAERLGRFLGSSATVTAGAV